MKVTDKNFVDPNQTLSKAKGAGKKSGVEKTTTDLASKLGKSSDDLASAKVQLSDRAQDMKKIKDRIDSTPDVDEAKVNKYKSMLAKGEYKVDAKAVADKMVDETIKNDFFASAFKDE